MCCKTDRIQNFLPIFGEVLIARTYVGYAKLMKELLAYHVCRSVCTTLDMLHMHACWLQQPVNYSSWTQGGIAGGLEQLHLSDCAIRHIEPGAFFNLVYLRWLDLSDNEIATIAGYTFSGSHLEHLFLNGNRRLALVRSSFAGLSVSGLYLHDCGLTQLSADSLQPLVGELRTLWIQANQIQRLGPELNSLVTSLAEFRVSPNPLHCDCELLWLKQLYDAYREDRPRADWGRRLAFTGNQPPACTTPEPLADRFISDLSVSDFRCQLPVFSDVDAEFDGSSGRLRCAAAGSPRPEVRWVQWPSYQPSAIVEVSQISYELEGHGVAEVVLEHRHDEGVQTSPTSVFSCVASNAAGNVSLAVTVQPRAAGSHNTPLNSGPPSERPTLVPVEADAEFSRDRGRPQDAPNDDVVAASNSATYAWFQSPQRRSKSTSGVGDQLVRDEEERRELPLVDSLRSRAATPEIVRPDVMSGAHSIGVFVVREVVCAAVITALGTVAIVIAFVQLVPCSVTRCRTFAEQESNKNEMAATSSDTRAAET